MNLWGAIKGKENIYSWKDKSIRWEIMITITSVKSVANKTPFVERTFSPCNSVDNLIYGWTFDSDLIFEHMCIIK